MAEVFLLVNLNVRNFFTARVVAEWNSLHSHVVEAVSMRCFRATVTKELRCTR